MFTPTHAEQSGVVVLREKNDYGDEYATKEMRSACDLCLLRKKKCDKGKPSCGTCVRKGNHCQYSAKRLRGRPPRKLVHAKAKSERCTARPEHAPSLQVPAIAGFGFQEMRFLNLYQSLFRDLCPAAADPNIFGRVLSTRHQMKSASSALSLNSADQADLVGVWSAVAVGSLFSGNTRDLGHYVARLRQATEDGGLSGGGGSDEVRARLPLALMHDVFGRTDEAYNALDLCCPQAGDTVASMSIMALFPILAGGCPQKFLDRFLALVKKGSQNFLDTPEQAHAQRAMNIFYEVYFAVLKAYKMPLEDHVGALEALEATIQACHHNLSQGEADMARRPEEYSPVVLFIVQDKLFLLELSCLGEVPDALSRCRRLSSGLLRAHPYLLHISYIRIKVCSMMYASWAAGEQDLYRTFADIWNAQAFVADGCQPFPPFQEYIPSRQCDHYYCKMWQPQFELACSTTTSPSDCMKETLASV